MIRQSTETYTKKITEIQQQRLLLQQDYENIKLQLDNERARAYDMEQDLLKAQQMASFLDTKVVYLEDQTMKSVPHETYESLKRAHDAALQKAADDDIYKVRVETI